MSEQADASEENFYHTAQRNDGMENRIKAKRQRGWNEKNPKQIYWEFQNQIVKRREKQYLKDQRINSPLLMEDVNPQSKTSMSSEQDE